MLHISDTIERTLVLPAERTMVWQKSFATPAALASWFPERIDGEFELGGTYTMIWGEYHCQCRLVEHIESESFVYQWHPGAACEISKFPESELSTVRFTLSDHPEGTQVLMVESGFLRIPEDRRVNAFTENNGGWDAELPKLQQAYAI